MSKRWETTQISGPRGWKLCLWGDSDSEDSIKKSEEPDEGPAGAVSDANNSVVRHSAKCAILTKKGWSAI